MKKILLLLLVPLLIGCVDYYTEGIEKFNTNEFIEAKNKFERVKPNDKNYDDAREKLNAIEVALIQQQVEKEKLDSIERAENWLKDSLTRIEKELKETEKFKEQLSGELKDAKVFKAGSEFRDEVTSLQYEIILFGAWNNLIKRAENHPDKEIQQIGKNLKAQAIRIQRSEFPALRKNYGEILRNKLWEQNIEVRTFGSGNSTIEFTAGMFANNKNKADFQNLLSENFHLFRFKKVNYKWYKYDDEYTYYTIKSSNDSELVTP